jgi:predicted XRE-type DNA-binding protein
MFGLPRADTVTRQRNRIAGQKSFVSVWDAIVDTPEEAENMKLRSSLMIALKAHMARVGLSQTEAAKIFGVTQPRVSDLVRGKINLFGLDALVNMAAAAGLHVEMTVQEAA